MGCYVFTGITYVSSSHLVHTLCINRDYEKISLSQLIHSITKKPSFPVNTQGINWERGFFGNPMY